MHKTHNFHTLDSSDDHINECSKNIFVQIVGITQEKKNGFIVEKKTSTGTYSPLWTKILDQANTQWN